MPSVNESVNPDFGLFCNPESRRAEGFSVALGRTLRQRPKLIHWEQVLAGDWEERLGEVPRFLRLESPGRNWRVEQRLLLLGAAIEDEEISHNWRRLPAEVVTSLPDEPGRVWPMRQWFLAWRRTLENLSQWARQHGLTSRWFCPPEDVACMFDKWKCQIALDAAGIAVPPALGLPRNFDELWELMRQAGRRRVFLKPCHGSSASGVVALEAGKNDIQAFSTLELTETANGLELHNNRRIRKWRGAAGVRKLVDAVCGERCLAQAWVPKAAQSGSPFDLRVVVIGGRARHVMMRLGRGPMTNSQLLGGKGDVELLRQKMGDEAWMRMLGLCESAMTRCFPLSLYAGLDVLVESNFRTARISEVNAFGDLLPRVLHEGRDTYTWEIEECLRREPVQVSSTGA